MKQKDIKNIEELREYCEKLEKQAEIDNSLINSQKARLAELEQSKVQKPYTLLKSRVQKDGKHFDNLYLMVGEGSKFAPIAIQLVRWNAKQKNLLLAIAQPAEIRRVTLVQNLDNPRSAVVTDNPQTVVVTETATGSVNVADDDLPF